MRPRERFARAIVAGRYAIVAFWVAAAIVLSLVLPSIDQAQVGALGDLVPNDAAAIQAEQRSATLFGFPLLSRNILVQRDPAGLSKAALARFATRTYALNRHLMPGLTGIAGALPLTNALARPPLARERGTTALTYLFFPTDIGPIGRAGLIDRLEKRSVSPPGDALVGATGSLSARQEQATVIENRLPLVEIATVLVVLAAVALHFRALVAPLLNLAAVAIAYLVAIRLIAYIGSRVGVSVPREVTPVIIVLLFGVLTDYSIFFLSRFRRLLAEELEPRAAAVRATAEIAPIVMVAGISVAAASAALLVARLGFLQAFGPGMALAVLVGLAVAVTFVPAIMAITGTATFWPSRPRRELPPEEAGEFVDASRRPGRSRALGLAARHPLVIALVCIAVLGAGASGLSHMKVGNPLIRGLPDANPISKAYAAAAKGFAPGVISPTVVVVEAGGIVARRKPLAHLQRLLTRQPGVAAVAGPGSVPFRVARGAALSSTGNAARYIVMLKSDPLGAAAIDDLRRLQRRMPGLLGDVGLPAAHASFAGDTALVSETVEETFGDLARVAPVAILAVALLLALFLRALVAPLYLVAASLLALCASLGATAYIFVDLLGYAELTYYVPFMATVLLLALGSDYNVFIVGRIWDTARTRPIRAAIVEAGASASKPIAAAGLILGLSFALLAIVPLAAFREIAVAMTVGLLIDAFLVRTLLVPALMALVGERSGWPGKRLVRPPVALPESTT